MVAIDKSYYFYVLLCADDTFYAGYTTSLTRRVNEHNTGVGAKYTRLTKRRPVKIIYYEECSNLSTALKKEYAFKQLSRQQKIVFLTEKAKKEVLK